MPKAKAPTPPAKTARPSRGAVARERLIHAAHAVFLKNGFHGTSMRQIATEAEVAVGGIYNHFATKDDLFAAVLDAYHPYHLIIPALEHLEGDTVEAFVHNAARRVYEANAQVAEQLLPLVLMDLVEFQGRHLRQLATKVLPRFMAVGEQLRHKQGRLRPITTPTQVRAFFSLMLGFMLTDLMLKDTAQAKAFRASSFEDFIDIYLHGILECSAS